MTTLPPHSQCVLLFPPPTIFALSTACSRCRQHDDIAATSVMTSPPLLSPQPPPHRQKTTFSLGISMVGGGAMNRGAIAMDGGRRDGGAGAITMDRNGAVGVVTIAIVGGGALDGGTALTPPLLTTTTTPPPFVTRHPPTSRLLLIVASSPLLRQQRADANALTSSSPPHPSS